MSDQQLALLSTDSLAIRRATVLDDIARAERAVEDALTRRLRLDEALNSTAPVMALPRHVLSEIFFLAIQEQFAEAEDENSNETPPRAPTGRLPFHLATLCRSLRRFVLETPRLWTLISLTYNESNQTRLNAVLVPWLARSAHYQIDIHLDYERGSRPNLVSGFGLLLHEAPRWRSLNSFVFSSIMSFIPGPQLPNLSTLTIRRAPGYNDDFITEHSRISRWPVFGNARIRRLRLLDTNPLCWKFDFTALVSFTGRVVLNALMHVLKTAPSLVECSVCIAPDDLTHQMPTPILMPRLEKLDISGQTSYVLLCITTPRLSHLKVNNFCFDDIHSFVERSGCQLRKMELVLGTDDTLSNLLPHVQSMNSFGVVLQPSLTMGDQLLTQIVSLPNLTTVNVTGKIAFQPTTFLNLIRLPSQAPRPLQDISIHYTNQSWITSVNPNVLRDFFQELPVLSVRGVVVDFKYIG